MIQDFNGKLYKEQGKSRKSITNEGPRAVHDAIKFLKAQQPVPTLEWSDALTQAARDHVNNMMSSGKIGHKGDDGSTPASRIERHE